MRAVSASLPKDAVVTVPEIYHFDEDAHLIIMEYCGDDVPHLKQLLRHVSIVLVVQKAHRLRLQLL